MIIYEPAKLGKPDRIRSVAEPDTLTAIAVVANFFYVCTPRQEKFCRG